MVKIYEIKLDEAVSHFFEKIVMIVKRPVEDILSDALFIQVEMINWKILQIDVVDNE